MKRAVTLGAGLVGATIARDLSAEGDFAVTLVDQREQALEPFQDSRNVTTVQANLTDSAVVSRLAAEADVVLGALPGHLGYKTLRAVLESGTSCVDISGMAEDPVDLFDLAQDRGVIAVVDCGFSPGVSNMMAGYACLQLDPCDRLDIFAGGLPVERRHPFEYKSDRSHAEVLTDYIRPARVVEQGKVVIREALSEPEPIEFPAVGTLEAFTTDGLHSLPETLQIPFMRAKSLRYPGHVERMRAFRDAGLFSAEPMDVRGQRLRPVDLAASLLSPHWTYEEGEPDLTLMRVVAYGVRKGARCEYRWHMHDTCDPATGTRSMSRTTAYPATTVARMITDGSFPLGPGVYPPEIPALRDKAFLPHILAELHKRGVRSVATVVEQT